MKYTWEKLPKPANAFTKRNATMRNLNTGEIIQHYSANTKLVMAEKCVTTKGTFYRTTSAAHHNLNWAFEATALGLPNEFAPLAQPEISSTKKDADETRKNIGTKQKANPTKDSPRAEGEHRMRSFLAKLFHRS